MYWDNPKRELQFKNCKLVSRMEYTKKQSSECVSQIDSVAGSGKMLLIWSPTEKILQSIR